MSETAAEKLAFRDAMKFRRCPIPADGFYEWKRLGSKEKQPYQFRMADGTSFAFAGLWERWQDPDQKIIESCTILTTQPNALVSEIHDRMPVIVAPDDYDLWLVRERSQPCCRVPASVRRKSHEEVRGQRARESSGKRR